MSSSGSSRRIHWPFSHSSRSRSKTAPPLWMASRSNSADELVDREDLVLGPARPAEQRQVVDQRLAQEPLGDVVRDRGLALALAHLRAVRVEDQRQVGEARLRVPERAEQQDVLRRVREMVLAADDVGDPHLGVVHHHREVVERAAVAADDHEVAAEVRDVDLDPAADDVVEGDDPLPDPEAQGASPALGLAGGPLLRRQRRAAADVLRRELRRLLGGAVGGQLLGRAVARVDEVLREEALGRGRVERQALHLAIRRVRAARFLAGDLRAFVPAQPEPVQALEDVGLEGERAARLVRVLQPQDERPADVAGEQIVEEGRPGGADVQRTGRARGDPDADRRGRGHHALSVPPRLGPCGTGRDRPRRAARGPVRPVGVPASRGRVARRASASRAIRSGPGS